MRFFTCVLEPNAHGIADAARREYERLPRACGLTVKWDTLADAAIMIAWQGEAGAPMVATYGASWGVGIVRLDNRVDIERLAQVDGMRYTDLELVLRVVLNYDVQHVSRFLGDFSFVVWNSDTRTAIVATDAFAVKKLYYASRGSQIAFASRGEALAMPDRYDRQLLAELAAGSLCSPGLTAYEGVRQLTGGSLGVVRDGRLVTRTYWDPRGHHADAALVTDPEGAAETCRELLGRAIQLRLGPTGRTWAQLSGGIDSSAVVSMTQWLAQRGDVSGLAGTVTYVDLAGTESDEREYTQAVIDRWGVPNHAIIDPPLWFDGAAQPPRTDRPQEAIVTHPRDRRLSAIVGAGGGAVLLSGFGSDELFSGSMVFFADWVASGRIGRAIAEMARRAALGRVSFWDLAYRNAVLPLLPASIGRWLLRNEAGVMPWVQPTAVRQYGLGEPLTMAASYGGAIRDKYGHALRTSVTAIGRYFDAGFLGDLLDVRYPFLYRPLAEFALRLPPELCVRPQARKWILREAMRGILPELVRARVGKGDSIAATASALARQWHLLAPLTCEPILADLGIIDAVRLRDAYATATGEPHRRNQLHARLQGVLALEAWLQLRSGRWPHASHVVRSASTQKDHQPSARGLSRRII